MWRRCLTGMKRYNETLKQIDELEKNGEIFVMRPDKPLEIGRLERSPEKLQQVYDTEGVMRS